MPIPLQGMLSLQNAVQAVQAGDRAKALEFADTYAVDSAGWLPACTNEELLMAVAPLGNLYEMLGEWELAALKHEDVCAHAEVHAADTPETAGDYRHLSEVYERLGNIERALEAHDASIRHLTKAGQMKVFAAYYDERSAKLKTLLHSRQPRDQDPAVKYWKDVSQICVDHVQRMSDFFKARGAQRMDWAERRFAALIQPSVITSVIKEAREHLEKSPDHGVTMPHPVQIANGWFVTMSVYPANDRARFLSECPGGSYEHLARLARRTFRSFDKTWVELDWAHWILLLDPENEQGAVHLHTIWNCNSVLQWVHEVQGTGKPANVAPTIVPVELLSEDSQEFIRQLILEDLEHTSRS